MYTQSIFKMEEGSEIRQLMRAFPLATLVTTTSVGLEANLLPLELTDQTAPLQLRGHVARTHPMFRFENESKEALVVFQSPNAYISPRWYVNGQRSGRVAPSWNYVAVEARGRLRFVDDPDWMLAHLDALTRLQEAHRDEPWSRQTAAPGFVEDAARHLIGFEIAVDQAVGKRFLSQQRTEADRQSLIRHLQLEPAGSAHDVSKLIAP